MADPIPFEQQAEALKIRSNPKPVTRINRKVVIIVAAIGVLLLFLGASVALDPPKADNRSTNTELYNTTSKPRAEELRALPASYADIPLLGEPVPGDLGAAIVETERELGLEHEIVEEPVIDFRPNPRVDRLRAEQIRLAKLKQESIEAPVFFQLSQRSGPQNGASEVSGGNLQASRLDPFSPNSTLPQTAFTGSSAIQNGNTDLNLQDSKNAFVGTATDSGIYNPHQLELAASPYQVMAGTVIPASLITGLNSDLPGSIIAQVTQNIYDTASGDHVLIPQGSKLLGRYDSRVSFGQSRALVVWDRIIFPDTSSILIEALPGTDQQGFAGLRDKVDNHLGRLFLAVGLATLLEVGSELSFSNDQGDIAEAIEESIQGSANQAGQRVVDRNLNIQATLKVRPGWPLRVIVTRDLILRPYNNEQEIGR